MGQLTVDDIDDEVIARLRRRAERRGRSLEQELREILAAASEPSREEMVAVIDRIRAMTPRDRPQTDSTLLVREDRDSR
jgi:antitoxin FitA